MSGIDPTKISNGGLVELYEKVRDEMVQRNLLEKPVGAAAIAGQIGQQPGPRDQDPAIAQPES